MGIGLMLIALIALAAPVRAHDATYSRAQGWLWLAAGAVTGLALHEAGHLAFDLVVGDKPHIIPVNLGPLVFFAIAPQDIKSSRQLYGAAMMGFCVEALYTEVIFARHPDLVHDHQPFAEGLLAFHVALDLGYAITGFTHVGPNESDVNSMARAAGVSPAAIGTMLALPLFFDVLRYFWPGFHRGAVWLGPASRALLLRGAFVL